MREVKEEHVHTLEGKSKEDKREKEKEKRRGRV